mgnify:CR=1 FL=1
MLAGVEYAEDVNIVIVFAPSNLVMGMEQLVVAFPKAIEILVRDSGNDTVRQYRFNMVYERYDQIFNFSI